MIHRLPLIRPARKAPADRHPKVYLGTLWGAIYLKSITPGRIRTSDRRIRNQEHPPENQVENEGFSPVTVCFTALSGELQIDDPCLFALVSAWSVLPASLRRSLASIVTDYLQGHK